MSFGKSFVIYVTRKKIWIANSTKAKSKLYEVAWDGNDPRKVFRSIKKTVKARSVKIVLGDDLSYVLTLQVPQTKTNRGHLLTLLEPMLPEKLSEDNFDWKLIGTNPKKKLNLVQIAAVPGRILNNLSFAAKASKIKIESIDPVTTLLAFRTKFIKNPHLIAWKDQETLGVIAYKGTVYLTEDISENAEKKIESLVDFAKSNFGLKINQAVIDWEGVDKEPKFPSQWKVKKGSLNPMAAASDKKKEKGKDEETLELKPVDKPSEPEEKTEGIPSKEETETETEAATAKETPAKAQDTSEASDVENEEKPEVKDSSEESDKEEETGNEDETLEEDEEEAKPVVNKKLLIILLVVVVVGGLVLGGVLYFRSRVEKTPETTEETTEVTPTPTPEQEEVSLEDYQVQVLNGSGIAGEAGTVAELLDSAGFEEVDTGNADSYDYTDTEVSLKESVPEGVFEAVGKALSDYRVVKADALEGDSEYDIVVTVGSTKSTTETESE